jgi:hypothetical protein
VDEDGDGEANYDVTTGTGTLEITKAPLKVIAEDKEKYYDEANPALTVKYEGFVNGQSASTINLKPELTTTAKKDSPIGKYIISFKVPDPAKPFDADNYKVTFESGTLTVEPAPHKIEFSWYGLTEWPETISGPIRLPFETSTGVPIEYTFTPSNAAEIVDYLLIPLRGGEIVLKTSTPSDPNYQDLKEVHVIQVSSPAARPTLREILLPKVPGVVTDWPAGIHYVVSGTNYSFKISPEKGRELTEAPVVRINFPDIIATVTANGDGTYTALIPNIMRDIEVSIEAAVTPSTGNAVISGDRIWSAGNRLYIQTASSGQAQVYSLSGALVKIIRYTAGETITELPAGIYIVNAYGKAQKVAITD